MTSLSNSLLMMPREMPSYIKVAYSLRYANEPNKGNFIARIYHAAQRVFLLIKEIIYYRPRYSDFRENREKLQRDFAEIRSTLAENQKPICVYFVSAHDHNGAILGNQLYYYHHYKIQNLQKHFAVAPQLYSSQNEMKIFMQTLKNQYPGREIRFVDVVSHGFKTVLATPAEEPRITPEVLRDDLFEDTAPDATILLDACMTGLGDRNIADEIARKTPGRTVLAPGPSMYFSKPIIQTKNKVSKVVSAVHGFAIFNAYTCKTFSYKERMPSRFPYVKAESFQGDILSIASFPVLQNAWLDPYLNEKREDHRQKVISIFEGLSAETKALIIKQVVKNNGSSHIGNEDTFGETFLRANPLHESVRSAFRTVFNELIHEVRDAPLVGTAKRILLMQNIFQAIAIRFRYLCGRSQA